MCILVYLKLWSLHFLKALLENVCLLYFVGFFMTFTHLLSTCSQPMQQILAIACLENAQGTFIFYLKDFQSYFFKTDKLYSRQLAILNKIFPAFEELWLPPTFSLIPVYFSKTLLIFMQDGEDLQSFAQSHRDFDLLHHALLGVVLQQSGHADQSHVT